MPTTKENLKEAFAGENRCNAFLIKILIINL
jgi:hypothetical protein